MKITILSLFVFISSFSFAQTDPPVRFEGDSVDFALIDFGGNASSLVVDPTDATNNVAQTIKTDVAELWAGTTMGLNGFANPLLLAPGATTMTVRVWSPDANTPIRLKIEDSTDPTVSVETETNTTMAAAWEMLTFDFTNEATGTAALNFASTYNKASIFFNFGTTGADAGEKTYYWDDVEFVPGTPNLFSLPVWFEADTSNFILSDFGGNASGFEVDPTDPNNNVARTTKTDIAELWAGTTLGQDGFPTPLPFASGSTMMSVRVWSPDANTPIRLKAEDSTNGAISVETETNTTMAGAWETITFDFSNEVSGTAAVDFANTYNKVSIFFNFGTTGADAGEKTYYWDDVEFVPGTPNLFNPPVLFEGDTSNFILSDFGGTASGFEVDPTDPNNNVARTTKTDIAELWAGTTLGQDGFDMSLPLANGSTMMSVRVWSPDANTPIRLKAEDSTNGAISVETETSTTMAGAWETITFDFSNEVSGTAAIDFANSYNKVSIFFNFGTTGADAGEKTYYWDDVLFLPGGPTPAALPVTFDDPNVSYDLVDFGENASSIVVDPTDGSNMVAQTIKTAAAELWAGTTVGLNGFPTVIPLTMSATKMSVRVWSPDANIPIRLKVEDSNDPTVSVETEAMVTTAMAWETLEFDFNNEAAGTAAINFASNYNKASIFFNFGTTGADAGEKTYFWDDLEFVEGTTPTFNPPVTFEADTSLFELIDFAGNASAFAVDPTDATNNVVQTIRTTSAEVFAGTVLGANGFTDALPFNSAETKMNVRIWSAESGVPMRLKVENSANGGISVETETISTVTAGWETIEFDFSNHVVGNPIDFANSYDKVVIFFNFGETGGQAGEQTYYWDDVKFGPVNVGTRALDAAAHDIAIYPNPVSDLMNIDFPESISGTVNLSLFDLAGRLMLNREINTIQANINMQNMKAGSYILRIETESKIYTQKIMKK